MNETQSSDDLVGLVNRAREGCGEATKELLNRVRPHVRNIAASVFPAVLSARTDASDITQEVLLVVGRQLPKFQGNSNGEFLSWLRQIIRSVRSDFLDHHFGAAKRSVSREERGSGQIPKNSLKAPSLSFDRRDEVQFILDRLPPQLSKVLKLVFVDGLCLSEAAAKLECDPTTARTRMREALRVAGRLLSGMKGE